MWLEALNLVGVPVASEWRKAENVYYPPNIREVPIALPCPAAPTPTSSKQPSVTQAFLPPSEVSKRSGKAGDQGQGVEMAKNRGLARVVLGQGKGKEVTHTLIKANCNELLLTQIN